MTPWSARRALEQIKETSATVTILREGDPDVLAGVPPERVALDTMRPLERQPRYVREVKRGRRRWAGVAWPARAWAAQVYPELDPDDARRKLAADLLSFCRLGQDDPPEAQGWRDHVEALDRRARTLTENAVAHIAFGYGFPESRTSDPRARGRRGANDSNVHQDVMIGSDDFEATGIAAGGRRVPLIADGAWQILSRSLLLRLPPCGRGGPLRRFRRRRARKPPGAGSARPRCSENRS